MYNKKNVNKNFFKNWTLEMGYILGFMFADGNITTNARGANYFAFYSMDKDVLEFIKKSVRSEHKISKRNARSGNVYRIQIGSKEMIFDLRNLGLIDTKVKRMKFPEIPEKYIAAFILGFFDGDGNVWMGKVNRKRKKSSYTLQTAFTSASIDFLKGLHLKLKILGIVGGFIYKIKNKNCYRLVLSVRDSLKLYKIMYNGSCTSFFLKRKEIVFKRYINMRA